MNMTEQDARFHAQWKASSGHPGGWRVTREFFGPWFNPEPGKPRFQEAEGKGGRLRLFRTYEGAKRLAARLNAPC